MTRPAGGKPHYRLKCIQVDWGGTKLYWVCIPPGSAPGAWSSMTWHNSSAEAIRRAPR